MKHPLIANNAQKIQYISYCILFAALVFTACWKLSSSALAVVLVDAIVHAFILGALGILIDRILHYANFEVLNVYQRFVNQIALLGLCLLLWLALAFIIVIGLFGLSMQDYLWSSIWQKACLGFMAYLLLMQHIRHEKNNESHPVLKEENVLDVLPVAEPADLIDRVSIKSGLKIHVLMISDIYCILSDGDYVHIMTEKSRFLKEQTMKYFEEHLPGDKFVRVHRSAIVNVEMISHIELYEKQSQLLTLKNGERIKASAAGYKLLRTRLQL